MNTKDVISRWLKQGLAVPTWVLVLSALVLAAAAFLGVQISDFVWILLLLLLMIIGLFPNWQRTATGRQRELSDPDAPGQKITLSNLPENVEPILEPIPSRDDLKKIQIDIDGDGKVLSIAGNLIFRDTNDKLVTSFSAPIKVTFNYTEADEREAQERQAAFIQKGLLPQNGSVEIIPIYLYTYPTESKDPEFQIWKPFQNFTRDESKRTLTVEVYFWGDQPISGGTRP